MTRSPAVPLVALTTLTLAMAAVAQDAKTASVFESINPKRLPAPLRAPKDLPEDFLAMIGVGDGRADTIALRPDEKQLALTTPDGTLNVWYLPSLKRTRLAKGFVKEASATAFHPKNGTLAVGDSKGNLSLWNLTLTQPRALLKATPAHEGGPVYAIAYAPDCNRLATGGSDGALKLWDVTGATPKLAAELKGQSKYARSVSFTPDGALLACAWPEEKLARVYDLSTDPPEVLAELEHTDSVASVEFSADGKMLATSSYDGRVRVYSCAEQKPKLQGQFSAAKRKVRQVRFTPDGQSLVGLMKDEASDSLARWDLRGKPLRKWEFPHHLNGVLLSADGKFLLTCNEDCAYIARVGD